MFFYNLKFIWNEQQNNWLNCNSNRFFRRTLFFRNTLGTYDTYRWSAIYDGTKIYFF